MLADEQRLLRHPQAVPASTPFCQSPRETPRASERTPVAARTSEGAPGRPKKLNGFSSGAGANVRLGPRRSENLHAAAEQNQSRVKPLVRVCLLLPSSREAIPPAVTKPKNSWLGAEYLSGGSWTWRAQALNGCRRRVSRKQRLIQARGSLPAYPPAMEAGRRPSLTSSRQNKKRRYEGVTG